MKQEPDPPTSLSLRSVLYGPYSQSHQPGPEAEPNSQIGVDMVSSEREESMKPLLLASVVFTSLVGTLLGYDIGIISGAIIFIKEDFHLNSFQAPIMLVFHETEIIIIMKSAGRNHRWLSQSCQCVWRTWVR